jgi:hypothetical protein
MGTMRRTMSTLCLFRHLKGHFHTRSEIGEHITPEEEPLHEPGPEIIVEGLGAIFARGGLVKDFASANFPAFLSEERYPVIVKARDVSHIIQTGQCGGSDRGGARGGLKTPAAGDRIDAHGIGGEESGRDKERFESLLETYGVVFVKEDKGLGEGTEVGDWGERHRVDHS